MKNLFAYGTLMCEDDHGRRLGLSSAAPMPGILKGYSRWSVKGEPYPALIQDEKNLVEGVVYRNAPDSAWDRLDAFEGEMYERRLVRIDLDGVTTLLAMTYVVRPEFLDHLEKSGWDFAQFLRSGKAGFQNDYKRYRSLQS